MSHDRNTQDLKEKANINFKTVAEKANVSKVWLYREESIANQIKKHRI